MSSCCCFAYPWMARRSSGHAKPTDAPKLDDAAQCHPSGYVDRRMAKDGYAYSREEFISFYGGEAWKSMWDDSQTEEEWLEEISTWTGASSLESSDEQGFSSLEPGVISEAPCAQCGCQSSCMEGKGVFLRVAYCEDCWSSWRASVASVPRTLSEHTWSAEDRIPEPRERRTPGRGHFDFIEVGTSDWCTISQYCAGDLDLGSWNGADIRTSLDDLWEARGIAVEAVGEHLAALPQLPRVAHVEAAMGEFCGEAILYHVSTENIAKHMGEFYATLHREVDVMWYAKSMSSVGKPHPELEHLLRSIGRLDLLEQRVIKVLSWGGLCALHGVETLDLVQLDCEGMDCSVLRGLLRHCKEHPAAFPRRISFEANWLTEPQEVEETLAALLASGYRLESRSWENITVERG